MVEILVMKSDDKSIDNRNQLLKKNDPYNLYPY